MSRTGSLAHGRPAAGLDRRYFGFMGLRSIALATAALGLTLFGQVEQARITGAVRDASGGVVPHARITMIHEETNVEHVAETNEVGSYVSAPLRIGRYRVIASAGGFKRSVRSGVLLRIQETVLLDFTLEVGTVTETVDVTAAPPLLETTDPSQGQVIDNKKIVDLPLNGRDFLALAALSSPYPSSITGLESKGKAPAIGG